ETLHPALLKVFPPALLGRIVVVPYYPLSQEVLIKIIGLKLGKVAKRLKSGYNTALEWTPALTDLMISRSTQADAGARIIDNIITNAILPKLSTLMLNRTLEQTTTTRAILSADNGEVVITAEP
ncbi:MAG: hypothetical protein RSA21_09395, partial [Akkermansia sp.]